jgi:hypothetical protein
VCLSTVCGVCVYKRMFVKKRIRDMTTMMFLRLLLTSRHNSDTNNYHRLDSAATVAMNALFRQTFNSFL